VRPAPPRRADAAPAASLSSGAVDLIALGSVFVEVVFGHVPALPRPGEEVFADEFGLSCGGAVTAASAASQAGARAGLAAVLGDDLGSRVVTEHCRRAGVDLSPSRRVSGRSAGISVVLNFDGDRAFITYLPPRRRPGAKHWHEVLRSYRPAWCYLHPGPGVARLLRAARSLGIRVALDVNLEEIAAYPATVLSCARLADLFLPNEEELLRLARASSLRAALGAAAEWCPVTVVKRGAGGAVVVSREAVTEVTHGVEQVTVRDRTGAGDSFAGALIAALCRGVPVTGAVAAANTAGSQAVSRLGAVGEVDMAGLLGTAGPLAAAGVLSAAHGAAAAPGNPAGSAPGPGGPGGASAPAGSGTGTRSRTDDER